MLQLGCYSNGQAGILAKLSLRRSKGGVLWEVSFLQETVNKLKNKNPKPACIYHLLCAVSQTSYYFNKLTVTGGNTFPPWSFRLAQRLAKKQNMLPNSLKMANTVFTNTEINAVLRHYKMGEN